MPKEVLGFDINFLKQIKSLIQETNIDEIEIEEGENRYIRVSKRKENGCAPVPVQYAPQPSYLQTTVAAQAASQAVQPAVKTLNFEDESKYFKIQSPVIGTYYEAPSPDSPPFVRMGDSVSSDTTVCIVEAMKVMNEIKAECKGKIVEMLKANASSVQSGEAIFIVEKS